MVTRLEMGNCAQCRGTGKFERPPYDGRPAEVVTCWRCEGTGRAVVEVADISVKPHPNNMRCIGAWNHDGTRIV